MASLILSFYALGLLKSRESLFSYHNGKKHKDFVDVKYVPMFFDELDSLFIDKTLEIQAKEACGDVKECLFDIAASGSLSFGNSTKESVKHYNKRKKDINTGNALRNCESFCFFRLFYFPQKILFILTVSVGSKTTSLSIAML